MLLRYYVGELLGSGAFAQVWQCKDLRTSKEVAVKVLKSDSAVRDMGEEEVIMLRSLKKSGSKVLMEILDNFVEEGPNNGKHICIVTELLGPSLLDCLHPAGMHLNNVRQVASQILSGLHFLHTTAKIIHTDIKPENVLLSDNRLGASNFSEKVEGIKVKLADFGCALRVGEVYPAIVGTSEYRAPELLLESPYGVGIDIWATACLLVELATGKYLFRPDSSPNVLKEEKHLALMTKLLGPVPQLMVRSGRAWRSFYSKRTGELHHFPLHSLQSEDFSLTTLLEERRGKAEDEDDSFSQFLLPLLEFRPEMRITADGALEHPFIVGSADAEAVQVSMQNVRLVEPLHIMQDLRTEADQFQPKVVKNLKISEVDETAGPDETGDEVRLQNPIDESGGTAQHSSKKRAVLTWQEDGIDAMQDVGKALLSSIERPKLVKSKRGKRASEAMKASESGLMQKTQMKRKMEGETGQSSETLGTDNRRSNLPAEERKASKMARLKLKKVAKQSLARDVGGLTNLRPTVGSSGVKTLELKSPKRFACFYCNEKFSTKSTLKEHMKMELAKKIEKSKTRKTFVTKGQAATERRVELPLMDEILPVAMEKVVDGRGLVTAKAMVNYVSKRYPQLGVKKGWLWKFKEALNMELARGNILLVRKPFKNVSTVQLDAMTIGRGAETFDMLF